MVRVLMCLNLLSNLHIKEREKLLSYIMEIPAKYPSWSWTVLCVYEIKNGYSANSPISFKRLACFYLLYNLYIVIYFFLLSLSGGQKFCKQVHVTAVSLLHQFLSIYTIYTCVCFLFQTYIYFFSALSLTRIFLKVRQHSAYFQCQEWIFFIKEIIVDSILTPFYLTHLSSDLHMKKN